MIENSRSVVLSRVACVCHDINPHSTFRTFKPSSHDCARLMFSFSKYHQASLPCFKRVVPKAASSMSATSNGDFESGGKTSFALVKSHETRPVLIPLSYSDARLAIILLDLAENR
jgi:hypothetical protein